ncbi:MAG: winged helix-turn-helix transcriptional regulator [Balneolales bacterium]
MITGTKKEILNMIKREGRLSLEKIAIGMDLAKTTLREHFLNLERDGLILREYVRSGPGRPSLQFQLTAKGNNYFPSSESVMMREFIRYLQQEGKTELMEDFFKAFWEKRFQNAKGRMDAYPESEPAKRLEALSDILEEEGFMPAYQSDGTGNNIAIRECNCPFREVVKETQLPCKLEAEFYERLFGGKVERTSYIAAGDYSCTYQISVNRKE